MKIEKTASAKWQGTIKEGKGLISTQSGALTEQPYGFNTRFEDKKGTNPEELIGAAHAGCFTMALSKMLTENNLEVKNLETTAKVILEKEGEGFAIPDIYLSLKAQVGGADKEKVIELANEAKSGCPVSKLFNANIHLNTEVI